jgi:hypothetical protein
MGFAGRPAAASAMFDGTEPRHVVIAMSNRKFPLWEGLALPDKLRQPDPLPSATPLLAAYRLLPTPVSIAGADERPDEVFG